MTPLLRFVVDSKPTGLKKRAELGIVTAEIPKNRAVGEDKAHEGRVSLKELRAIRRAATTQEENLTVVARTRAFVDLLFFLPCVWMFRCLNETQKKSFFFCSMLLG